MQVRHARMIFLAGSVCLASCSPVDREPEEAERGARGAASVETPSAESPGPTVQDAAAFIARAESELLDDREFRERIDWVHATFINYDTDWLATRVGADSTTLAVGLANQTKQFEGIELPADLERKMNLLRTGISLPAPSRDGAAEELSGLATWLGSAYATGTFTVGELTFDLSAAEEIMDSSRDPEELAATWAGWRTIAEPMAERYERMVEIANEGARELGFSNLAEMWLSNYDMPPPAVEAEVERLWGQVEPLYEQLHCHVRAELNEFYGDEVQPDSGPLRADLLGNMWAQQWSNIYDLVAPESAGPGIDLTAILNEKGYTARRMVETGESFFSSLGFEPLPETFWERSLITRPRDRAVECHASAWDLDAVEDLRIKMCTDINAEDFQVLHHELGHNYYQRAYADQDALYRDGAHDGFHEAIGDFVALSITPAYLEQIDLIDRVPDSSADLGLLMRQALDKIAFLPFGLLVDQWRWSVLRGEVERDGYNALWWELRERYQGIEPPVQRGAAAFDPGAKFHIPDNTPYLRYFLSFIMQFQFHQAACEIAGWEGPLHRCSIYGHEEVGRRLEAMLSLGRSRPWPDVLETFTGTRDMDAAAIITYFEPLLTYLEAQNATRDCGW